NRGVRVPDESLLAALRGGAFAGAARRVPDARARAGTRTLWPAARRPARRAGAVILDAGAGAHRFTEIVVSDPVAAADLGGDGRPSRRSRHGDAEGAGAGAPARQRKACLVVVAGDVIAAAAEVRPPEALIDGAGLALGAGVPDVPGAAGEAPEQREGQERK